MNDDQFDKLYVYMQGEFGSLNSELGDIKDEIRALRSIPDDVATLQMNKQRATFNSNAC